MALFRLDSSIRTEGSVSREVADAVEDAWVQHRPGDGVVRRDIGLAPLPSDAWPAAVGGAHVPEDERTPEQRSAVALAATLADELLDAQTILIAAPLYNFGVPAHLKAWIDLVITDPRFGPGNRPLAGRPVILVAGARRRLRRGHPARGLGPRHALPAADPPRRVGRRRHAGGGRADAGRRHPGAGRAARRRRRLPERRPARRRRRSATRTPR